jgi:hypothetical protein
MERKVKKSVQLQADLIGVGGIYQKPEEACA